MQQKRKEKREREREVTYHVDVGIISYFLCTGGKIKSVSRLFNMAECWTQGAYDSSPCIPTK